MGTSPVVLAGVGLDTTTGTATPGFTLTFDGSVVATAATDYKIWYAAGVPSVWNQGTPYIKDYVPPRRGNKHPSRAGGDPGAATSPSKLRHRPPGDPPKHRSVSVSRLHPPGFRRYLHSGVSNSCRLVPASKSRYS
ncbi:MAG: hypothetical protein WAM66_04065 [Acidobacteriaceae bacterium]